MTFEHKELEESVLKGVSCVAVPIEIYESSNGKTEITTYTFCEKITEEFEKTFKNNYLSQSALIWIDENYSELMKEIGYIHYHHPNELVYEFIMNPGDDMLSNSKIDVKMISTNAELKILCENTGCDIEINDDGFDIIFAVVLDGKILSYAGMNDIQYGDGSVEISVETDENYRRKGYGKACVTALCRYISGLGRAVRFKCSYENTASYALAKSCGFTLEGKRYSYLCANINDK